VPVGAGAENNWLPGDHTGQRLCVVAWLKVDRLNLASQNNQPDFRGRITFADLAHHYEHQELGEQDDATDPKPHTTMAGYKRVLRNEYCDAKAAISRPLHRPKNASSILASLRPVA